MKPGEKISVDEEVEALDLMVVVRGNLKVEYNETEANGTDIKVRYLGEQGGIFPIKNTDNQYMKSIEVVGEDIVVMMSIERLKFRQIVLSVRFTTLNINIGSLCERTSA
jgi:CRP-like cAMP-binding protein